MGNSNSVAAVDLRPQVPDTWSADDIEPQSGKVVVITGANSGIGYETALELARKGADVVLACRNEGRGKEAEQTLREALASNPDAGSVEFKMLDVSDLGSVNKFAEEFKATHDRLDVLINNAGVMAVPYAKTVDGYERQFATNHLGHFALTAQLFPLLKQSSGQCTTLTNLVVPPATEWGFFTSLVWRFGRTLPLTQDAPTGALPTRYAATAPDVESSDYYGPGNRFEVWGPPKRVEAKPLAHSEAAAQALWEESERLAKIKFDVK